MPTKKAYNSLGNNMSAKLGFSNNSFTTLFFVICIPSHYTKPLKTSGLTLKRLGRRCICLFVFLFDGRKPLFVKLDKVLLFFAKF